MKGKRVPVILLVILIVALPILLIGIKQTLDNRSSAAAADKLEIESGTLSSSGVSKQTDSNASGGSYALFQNQTSNPTPNQTGGKFPPTLSLLPFITSYPYLPPKLANGQTYKDVDYGGTIRRISATGPTQSQGTMGYPTYAAFNSDDTRILITNNTRWLYDANSYTYLGVLSGLSIPIWSNRLTSPGGPNKLWGVSDHDNKFIRLDADTKAMETMFTFSNYSLVTTGRAVSQDDTVFALKGKKANGEVWLIIFNPVENRIIAEKKLVHPTTGNNYEPKNVTVSKTGQYIVIGYGVGTPTAEWGTFFMKTSDLSWLSSIGSKETWHADWCIDSQGRDGFVTQAGTMIVPSSLQTVDLFPNRAGKQIMAGHISCRGPDGWAYPSTNVAYQTLENNRGFDMIYRVKLDGSGQVQVWGFAHTISHPGETYYVGDWTDPYSNPSRRGDKVVFGSKWAAPNTMPTETQLYIMEYK